MLKSLPNANGEAPRLVHRLDRDTSGGLVVAALVAVPGASSALRGGVVAYATDLKHTLLGVDAGLLGRVGAVHEDVARAMAEGVRDRLGATYGVATTGVAGPDPQDERAPGTVFVAVAGPGRTLVEPGVDVASGRTAVRAWAVRTALSTLHEMVGTITATRGRDPRTSDGPDGYG